MENTTQSFIDEPITQEPIPIKSFNTINRFRIVTILICIVFVFAISTLLLVSKLNTKKSESTNKSVSQKLTPSVTMIPFEQTMNIIGIHGSSMIPNFLDGEFYSVDRNYYISHPLRRGDVVLFFLPSNVKYAQPIEYVKRVIGLPNESINISTGKVYINGEPLSEPYISPDIKTTIFPGSFIQEGVEFTIPHDQFFVLGDNRTHSSDSRDRGFISRANIIGKISTRVENYIPPTSSPEQMEIMKKNDLIESVGQKIEIMRSVTDMCSHLSSFQIREVGCILNDESTCNMRNMTTDQLEKLSKLTETAITDCLHYQNENKANRSK